MNRAAHLMIGLPLGGISAGWMARDQEGKHSLCEILGGVLGGYAGARLADWLDPPTNPNHRSWGHGFLPNLAVGGLFASFLKSIQELLREQAEKVRAKRKRLTSSLEKAFCGFIEFALRLLSGFLAGLFWAHLSHLALDACTAKGLPLIS